MDYKSEGKELIEKMTAYRNDHKSNDWKLIKTHEDITVCSRHSKDFDGTQYKVEGTVNAPPSVVFEYIEPLPGDSKRMQWDKNMKSIDEIETIDETTWVIRVISCSAAGGVISSRDFIDLVITQKSDEYLSTNAVTIDHPKCPVESKYVRGHNYPCGLTCIPVEGDPNKTLMRNFLQPDLKGMLPRALVESAFPGSQVEFFKNLRAKLAKDGKLSSLH